MRTLSKAASGGIAALCAALSLAACTGSQQSESQASSQPSEQPSQTSTAAQSSPLAPPNQTAPAKYRIDFETSQGPVIVDVTRSEAPLGADRLYNLVKSGYFDGTRFFRVVPGFVVQWGLAADPGVTSAWNVPIQDDPVKGSNVRGTLSFATSGANSRTAQLFINLGNNARLDAMGFSPVGKVSSGMENVDKIYSGYGEQPDQTQITDQGNAYLNKTFPKLDYIKSARIVK